MFKKLIAPLLFAVVSSGAFAQSAPTIEMTVDGLVCAFCAQGIEKKMRKLDATADVFVSLEHRTVAVALKDGKDIGDAVLKELMTDAGYTLRDVTRTETPLESIRKRLAGS